MIKVSDADGKDPTDTDDFSIDWVNYLSEGETIASDAASGTGVTVDAHSTADTLSTARLSGGTAGDNASILFTITTSSGRVLHQTLVLPIRTQ